MHTSAAVVEPLVLDEADAPLDGWDDPVKGRIRWRTLFSKGRTPTDGITCGVAELNPGDWLGLHRPAPPEVYYVIAGEGIVTLSGKDTPVKAGSAVFIPAMAEHGIRQTGDGGLALLLRLSGRFVRQHRISVLGRIVDAAVGRVRRAHRARLQLASGRA